MTPGDWILFAVVSVLATNHVLIRLPGWQQRAWLFWLVQLLNMSAAGVLLLEGLPGFSGNLSVVNYVLALLFVVRAVQNNNRWGRRGQDGRQSDEADERKAAILAALRRGEAPDGDIPGAQSDPSSGADA
ncbi:MAG: hypothetical protein VX265_17185 [Myxococcota bacterium]|nr:hypothetical protein [Myxococcota bacterium]